MTLREKIEVMEAFERGEEIEVKHRDSAMDWTSTKQPLWDWTKSTFRIKPKSKQTVTIEKWLCQHDAIYIIVSSSDIKKVCHKVLETYKTHRHL